MEYKGACLKKRTEENKLFWAKQREKERIAKEIRERKEKEEQDFKDLLLQAARWREANLLREYLTHLEQQAIATNTFTDDQKNHISWALKKTDAYNQYIKKETDLVENNKDDNTIDEFW